MTDDDRGHFEKGRWIKDISLSEISDIALEQEIARVGHITIRFPSSTAPQGKRAIIGPLFGRQHTLHPTRFGADWTTINRILNIAATRARYTIIDECVDL
jgi:hypothetical protein